MINQVKAIDDNLKRIYNMPEPAEWSAEDSYETTH